MLAENMLTCCDVFGTKHGSKSRVSLYKETVYQEASVYIRNTPCVRSCLTSHPVASMFIHLLTFPVQVIADYTIDERLCFLVCNGYHQWCCWGLYHFFSAVLLSTLALYQVWTVSKATISKVGIVVDVSFPVGFWSSGNMDSWIICISICSCCLRALHRSSRSESVRWQSETDT